MQRLLATAAITAVTLFAPQIVLAQASYSEDQAHSSVPDQIRSGLEQSGFTNIQGVPDAILVRAIDPDGNPVTMVVDTDTFKDISTGDGSNGQTTGRSAKMTDDSENATSPSESNQSISQSEKITSGPQKAEPLTLTNIQRQAIWQLIDTGRQMAAGIPGARFIALPGRNHLFLKHDPAAARFSEEINLFLTK
jgi:hypothetical protein